MSYRLCLTLSVLFLAACGRTFPVPSSGNGPQPVPVPEPYSGGSRERLTVFSGVTLTPSDDIRHYLTTSSTLLQLVTDTGSNQGVVETTLGFSLAYSRNFPTRTRITGILTRMSVTTEGLTPAPDQLPQLPLEFTGHVENGGLHLDSLAGLPINTVVDCQAAGLNGITGVQRSLVVPPLLISTGTTWTDSSTVPACSGSVQLTLTAVRTYTVAGQALRGTHSVIVVDRQDRVRAAGEGAQGQHRISVLSQGSGSARIYLDRTTGLLHESEARQTIDLVIGSSGRSQRFRQVVEEQTHLQK